MQPITGGNGHQLFADINDLLNVKAPIIKEAYCASHHATFHHPIHHIRANLAKILSCRIDPPLR